MTVEQSVLLGWLEQIKLYQDGIEASELMLADFKGKVLNAMNTNGIDKIDASTSLGVIATKVIRKDFHYDETILHSKLGTRYNEVLAVDKKRVDALVVEIPAIKDAIVVDKETSFVKIKKVKNGSQNT
jgi:hypothetical protein